MNIQGLHVAFRVQFLGNDSHLVPKPQATDKAVGLRLTAAFAVVSG